jgi:hypothetical protein
MEKAVEKLGLRVVPYNLFFFVQNLHMVIETKTGWGEWDAKTPVAQQTKRQKQP